MRTRMSLDTTDPVVVDYTTEAEEAGIVLRRLSSIPSDSVSGFVPNLPEVIRQVPVHDLPMPLVHQPMHALNRVQHATPRSVGMLLRLQVRFEDRR